MNGLNWQPISQLPAYGTCVLIAAVEKNRNEPSIFLLDGIYVMMTSGLHIERSKERLIPDPLYTYYWISEGDLLPDVPGVHL